MTCQSTHLPRIAVVRYSSRCGSGNRASTDKECARNGSGTSPRGVAATRITVVCFALGRPGSGMRNRARLHRLRRRHRLPEPRPRQRGRRPRGPRAGVNHFLHQCFMVGAYEPYVAVAEEARRALARQRRHEDAARELGRGSGRGRRQDPVLRPAVRAWSSSTRIPRTHEPDDGDDVEARLQAGLRPTRNRCAPCACAVPVPRRLDRGRAARTRASVQAGRRSQGGCVHRAEEPVRARADSSGCLPSSSARFAELCDTHGILYVDDEVQCGDGRRRHDLGDRAV